MLREVQKAEQLKFSFLVSKINDLYILVVVLDFCSRSNLQNEALESSLKHGGGGGGVHRTPSQAHCRSTNSENFPKCP